MLRSFYHLSFLTYILTYIYTCLLACFYIYIYIYIYILSFYFPIPSHFLSPSSPVRRLVSSGDTARARTGASKRGSFSSHNGCSPRLSHICTRPCKKIVFSSMTMCKTRLLLQTLCIAYYPSNTLHHNISKSPFSPSSWIGQVCHTHEGVWISSEYHCITIFKSTFFSPVLLFSFHFLNLPSDLSSFFNCITLSNPAITAFTWRPGAKAVHRTLHTRPSTTTIFASTPLTVHKRMQLPCP